MAEISKNEWWRKLLHTPVLKTNLAMENGPFEDVVPSENGRKCGDSGYSIAMLVPHSPTEGR